MKNDAFIKGHMQWKDNRWLAFAAAYTYAERGDWSKSYEAFTILAQQEDALSERLSLDAERVRRFYASKAKDASKYSDYLIPSQEVTFYNDLEKGSLPNLKNDPNNAYYLLSQGKFDESKVFASNYEVYEPYVLRLLAASKGVKKELIEQALQLPDDVGINYNTVWSALGLAIRENKDTTSYFKTLDEIGIPNSIVAQFCELVKTSQFEKAANIISGQGFEVRANFYVLANTILNQKIPPKWKNYIKTILFIDQRPFL